MAFYDKFPYTNFQELNLDWITQEVSKVRDNRDASDASAAAALESERAAKASETEAAASAQASAESATSSAQSATEANNYVESTRDQLNLLQSRVNNIIPSGTQTEGNTELLDIRVGYDGVKYPSAGDAVRDQVSDIINVISFISTSALDGWINGYIRNADGTIGADNKHVVSPVFIKPGIDQNVSLFIATGYVVKMAVYDAKGVYRNLVSNYQAGTHTIAFSGNESYRFQIGKTPDATFSPSEVNKDIFALTIRKLTDESLTISGIAADAKATGKRLNIAESDIENVTDRFIVYNRFNKETITPNSYIDVITGQLATLDGFFASDYIDVRDLNIIDIVGTHIVALYDINKNFINAPSDADSRKKTKHINKPSNAYYLRFSTNNANLNIAQVGYNVSFDNRYDYGKFAMPDLMIEEEQEVDKTIVVASDGSGDYTSFTKALYENVDNGYDVIVKSGTYNIKNEYIALFGADVIASLSDDTDLGGFQYGVILRNRKITFETGAKLVCDFTGNTIDGSHRFSALRVDYNVDIEGLNLECIHTFYAIHDDYGLMNEAYTVKYKNCVVNAENLVQQNVIGGGCKKYSKHIIENCYFNNGTNSNIHTVRYHNTNQADAVPEIYVSNTFFNGTFTARWYGTQTSKMKVYVSGCKARAIYTMQEESGYDEQNVTLFKWCCEETSPVN